MTQFGSPGSATAAWVPQPPCIPTEILTSWQCPTVSRWHPHARHSRVSSSLPYQVLSALLYPLGHAATPLMSAQVTTPASSGGTSPLGRAQKSAAVLKVAPFLTGDPVGLHSGVRTVS